MSDDVERKATQVDSGWRSDPSAGERKATQVDSGWRASEKKTPVATQVDTGWRTKPETERRATAIDDGWRTGRDSQSRRSTQVDTGWREKIDAVLEPTDVMNSATANYFSTIEEFKNAVEKLNVLKSSLGNQYLIKGTISRAGGESIILLCSNADGNDVVAKVYYEPVNRKGSSISSRSNVLKYMGTEEGKRYTLAVTEIGLVAFGESKYYFEIMPYCASTDLSDDGAYSFEQLVEITKQLNEALHSIHQAGIIHRDIKPENLYELDGRIKLGDFGIAKNGAQGRSHITEHILGTEGYRAPEATRYVYSSASDYYSLGVTLASLYEGHFIFENMTYEMQTLAQESERLPLSRTDPNREQLENLLNGLCRINRNQRFGYEEVNRWLADHNYTGGGEGEEWPKSFRLLNDIYRDEKSMFYGITKDKQHWDEAQKMLYRKIVEQFFMSFRTDLARSAQIVDELYRSEQNDKGLAVFLKNLFPSGPIVWKGYAFNSLSELGDKILSADTLDIYCELFTNHCVSHWLSNTEGISVDDGTIRLVDFIEKLSATEPEVACYWFGNAFATKRMLKICNQTVSTIEEMITAMFSVPNVFYQTDGYTKMLSRIDGADLYGFLYSFGYKEIVEKEWESLDSCDTFNRVSILFSMMENIAIKAHISPDPIRVFFAYYGPIGLAVYTKKLVETNIYKALDVDGKQILSKIKDFQAPAAKNLNELFRIYYPLVESVEKLRRNLIDNPHCILTGVYVSKGIICTNLVGCFAFKIFDRVAPLGFNTWIESANRRVKNELQ